jgi:hypothetical protein
MAEPIFIVQGDTGPDIKITLTREDTGEVENLSGASVAMHFRRKNRDNVLFTLTGGGTVQEAEQGVVIFAFNGSQLDQVPGEYEGEVEVVYDSGQRETIYESIDFVIREDFA